MKLSMLTEPVVHPEVRQKVPNKDVGETKLLHKEEESSDGQSNTNIREKDVFDVLGLI